MLKKAIAAMAAEWFISFYLRSNLQANIKQICSVHDWLMI
jgi:hypothetical protein